MTEAQNNEPVSPAAESAGHKKINEMGPGGMTGDHDIGIIVSGQPAGGPNDLGEKAHEEAE